MDISSRGQVNPPPRILEYRKQVKIANALIKYFSYFLLLIFLGSLVVYFFTYQDSKDASIILMEVITIGVAWILVFLEYFFLIRPLAISKIQVYEDRILIRRGKKEITIVFDEVIEIKSAINKNVGGWFTLQLKNKKKYSFTILLERVDYILDSIVKYNPSLIEKERYLNLRKHLILSDHGIARLYDMFGKKYRMITIFITCFLPFIFLAVLYIKQSNQFIIHSPFLFYMDVFEWTLIYTGFLFTIFPLVINKIIDKHTMQRLEKNLADKRRDTQYESLIYKKMLPAYLVLQFAFFGGIFFTDINTLETISLAKGSKELNIEPGEILEYDRRYNCTDCKYKLKADDLVVTFMGLGRIVALPGETVAVNVKQKDKDNIERYIASVEEKQVPKKSIAIRTERGVTLIVEDENIDGKVLR